ncbi:MAG: cation diffusion facilitator family transporter [Bacteroidales bacterium]|nr:cation diffusion facilitator family transporter [Bacteroidales bacterium]
MTRTKQQSIVLASWIGILGNGFLSAAKITIGIFSGSLAVIGDGIDSASDIIISVLTLLIAGIVSKPPDARYAWGYEKADMIATKVLSFVIFFAGMQMIFITGKNLLTGAERELPSMLAVWVTIISICGKYTLSIVQLRIGKKTSSPMLIANAQNMKNDVLISISVLVGLIFTFVLKLPMIDTLAGLAVGGYIVKSAWDIFMDSNIALMDGIKDPSIYNRIFESIEKIPGVFNPHRVKSRQIGSLYEIVLDIEVDGHMSLQEAHEKAEEVEKSIRKNIDNIYDIVVHVEPLGLGSCDEKFGLDNNHKP